MLLCATDLGLAVDDEGSHYCLPEVTQGLLVIGPTAPICAAAIPPAQHASLLLHGERLAAAAAHACGIAHERALALRVDLAPTRSQSARCPAGIRFGDPLELESPRGRHPRW